MSKSIFQLIVLPHLASWSSSSRCHYRPQRSFSSGRAQAKAPAYAYAELADGGGPSAPGPIRRQEDAARYSWPEGAIDHGTLGRKGQRHRQSEAVWGAGHDPPVPVADAGPFRVDEICAPEGLRDEGNGGRTLTSNSAARSTESAADTGIFGTSSLLDAPHRAAVESTSREVPEDRPHTLSESAFPPPERPGDADRLAIPVSSIAGGPKRVRHLTIFYDALDTIERSFQNHSTLPLTTPFVPLHNSQARRIPRAISSRLTVSPSSSRIYAPLPPPIPPTLARLLDGGFLRLVTLYILRTPIHANNADLCSAVLARLERAGARHLAGKLVDGTCLAGSMLASVAEDVASRRGGSRRERLSASRTTGDVIDDGVGATHRTKLQPQSRKAWKRLPPPEKQAHVRAVQAERAERSNQAELAKKRAERRAARAQIQEGARVAWTAHYNSHLAKSLVGTRIDTTPVPEKEMGSGEMASGGNRGMELDDGSAVMRDGVKVNGDASLQGAAHQSGARVASADVACTSTLPSLANSASALTSLSTSDRQLLPHRPFPASTPDHPAASPSAQTSPPSLYPNSTSTNYRIPHTSTFPPASQTYAQLRALLARISTLESERGFRPDAVTANLIVKCWGACWDMKRMVAETYEEHCRASASGNASASGSGQTAGMAGVHVAVEGEGEGKGPKGKGKGSKSARRREAVLKFGKDAVAQVARERRAEAAAKASAAGRQADPSSSAKPRKAPVPLPLPVTSTTARVHTGRATRIPRATLAPHTDVQSTSPSELLKTSAEISGQSSLADQSWSSTPQSQASGAHSHAEAVSEPSFASGSAPASSTTSSIQQKRSKGATDTVPTAVHAKKEAEEAESEADSDLEFGSDVVHDEPIFRSEMGALFRFVSGLYEDEVARLEAAAAAVEAAEAKPAPENIAPPETVDHPPGTADSPQISSSTASSSISEPSPSSPDASSNPPPLHTPALPQQLSPLDNETAHAATAGSATTAEAIAAATAATRLYRSIRAFANPLDRRVRRRGLVQLAEEIKEWKLRIKARVERVEDVAQAVRVAEGRASEEAEGQ